MTIHWIVNINKFNCRKPTSDKLITFLTVPVTISVFTKRASYKWTWLVLWNIHACYQRRRIFMFHNKFDPKIIIRSYRKQFWNFWMRDKLCFKSFLGHHEITYDAIYEKGTSAHPSLWKFRRECPRHVSALQYPCVQWLQESPYVHGCLTSKLWSWRSRLVFQQIISVVCDNIAIPARYSSLLMISESNPFSCIKVFSFL